MHRRRLLELALVAALAVATPPSALGATPAGGPNAPSDRQALESLAGSYTAAWNSGRPEAVAGHYAEDGEIVINRGAPWRGRARIAEMAAGFFAAVPDLKLACDGIRPAGGHVLYLWTFTGHDAKTGHPLIVHGWEEWDLGDDLKVQASRGWYDAAGYARQVAGGAP